MPRRNAAAVDILRSRPNKSKVASRFPKMPTRATSAPPPEQIGVNFPNAKKRIGRILAISPKRKGKVSARRGALLKAGRHFLSQHDYDEVSIASITRRADCSVGAFYGRFPAKELWIDAVIDDAFREATTEAGSQLTKRWLADASLLGVVNHLILLVSTEAEKSAGVLRAALKRSLTHPPSLEPVLLYWKAVAELTSELLSERLRGVRNPKRAVHLAVHLLHSLIVQDAVGSCNLITGELSQSPGATPSELAYLFSRALNIQTGKAKI